MRINTYIRGSVLPTVIVVSVLMLTGLLGLLTLWEQETLAFARSCRLRQARADVESAYTLYRTHSGNDRLLSSTGFQLHDSMPQSQIRVEVLPWGLYEVVRVTTQDSLLSVCRLFGSELDTLSTLFYADNKSPLTLAGRTILRGQLQLPANGLSYGRVEQNFYCGPEVQRTAIRRSEKRLPATLPSAQQQLAVLLGTRRDGAGTELPDSLFHSFHLPETVFTLTDARLSNCILQGKIILHARELRIGASCRMEHILICARKIVVEAGAQIAAQLFARDTVIIESGASLEYPSGVFARDYVEVGENVRVNGYVIVQDTALRKKVTPNYHQARSARVRGLVWIDGTAQIQGVVAGRLVLRQAIYFSPQGYYKDLIYDAALLANPYTAQPIWTQATDRRKEAVCVN